MQSDIVKIGPLEISKIVFDAAALLSSVVIGGLISYLTSRFADNRKRKHQKKDRLLAEQREAFALALEWIQPIEFALIRVSTVTALFRGDIDSHEFRQYWPSLLVSAEPMGKDIPVRLEALLPPDTIKRRDRILRQLEELRSWSLRSRPASSNKSTERIEALLIEFSQREEAIRHNFELFSQELTDQYKKTFE